jgi:hypothetical protein
MGLLTGCGDGGRADQPFELRGQPINPSPTTAGKQNAVTSPKEIKDTLFKTNQTAGTPALADGIELNGKFALAPENPAAAANASPAPSATAESSSTKGNVGTDSDGFQTVGFERLSAYEFEVSDEVMNPSTNAPVDLAARTESQIPQEIKALNQTRIALRGFMLPLKVEGGLVTELLVMKDQSMCCFGTVPKINEWVSVKMVSKGVKPIMDQPITLFGKLNVGEMRENGYLVGIYSMDGEKMAGPLDN